MCGAVKVKHVRNKVNHWGIEWSMTVDDMDGDERLVCRVKFEDGSECVIGEWSPHLGDDGPGALFAKRHGPSILGADLDPNPVPMPKRAFRREVERIASMVETAVWEYEDKWDGVSDMAFIVMDATEFYASNVLDPEPPARELHILLTEHWRMR